MPLCHADYFEIQLRKLVSYHTWEKTRGPWFTHPLHLFWNTVTLKVMNHFSVMPSPGEASLHRHINKWVASLHIGQLSGNDLYYHSLISYFFSLFSDLKIRFITGRRKTFSLWASRLLSVATHQGCLLPILINLSQFYTMVILMLNLLTYSLTTNT